VVTRELAIRSDGWEVRPRDFQAAFLFRLPRGTSSGRPYSSCVWAGRSGWSAASSRPSTAAASSAWSVSANSSTDSSLASSIEERVWDPPPCPALRSPTCDGSVPSSSSCASRSLLRSGARSSSTGCCLLAIRILQGFLSVIASYAHGSSSGLHCIRALSKGHAAFCKQLIYPANSPS